MTRLLSVCCAVLLLPGALAAQQTSDARVRGALPQEAADIVVGQLEAMAVDGLPQAPVVNLVLEGVSKGHPPAVIVGAVEALVSDIIDARAAFEGSGRNPSAREVESATTALRMGVDPTTITELVRAAPQGRSLEVPLLVLGGLAQSGMPADQALATLQQGLVADRADVDLVRGLSNRGTGRASGPPPGAGGGAAAGGGGGQGPGGAGGSVPLGPPEGAGRPPEANPGGRGGPQGGGFPNGGPTDGGARGGGPPDGGPPGGRGRGGGGL